MNHRSIVSALAGLASGLGLVFGQGEVPIGTLSFGSATTTPKLSGVVLRAKLAPTAAGGTGSSALATVRILLGNSGANRVTLVEFTIDANLAGPATIDGMRLRTKEGAASVKQTLEGAPQPIAVGAGPQTFTTIVDTGTFDATRVVQFPADYELALVAGGVEALRGEMIPTSQAITAAALKSATATATAFLASSVTLAAGKVTSAQVEYIVDYKFPAPANQSPVKLDRIQITRGLPGEANFAVVAEARLGNLPLPDSGVGSLRVRGEVNPACAGASEAMLALRGKDPSGYYVALSASPAAGGSGAGPANGGCAAADFTAADNVARGQVRATTPIALPAELCVATPCVNLAANPRADAVFAANVAQGADGGAELALVQFNVLHQNYPTNTRFTSLRLYQKTGSGAVDSGVGSRFAVRYDSLPASGGFIGAASILSGPGIAALDQIIGTLYSASTYMRLESSAAAAVEGALDAKGGVVGVDFVKLSRVVASAMPEPPAEGEAVDAALQVLAPGSLYTIAGSFAVAPAQSSSSQLSLSGLSANFWGTAQRLLAVRRDAVFAQVPFGTSLGAQRLEVKVDAQRDALPSFVIVRQYAPAIFVRAMEGETAVAESAGADGLPMAGAAKAGDVIAVYATGLGQTVPALVSGQPARADATNRVAQTVMVTIGGTTVAAESAVAQRGEIGRYEVRFRVPQGLACEAAGEFCYQAVQLSMPGHASNVASVAVAKEAR